MAKVKTVYVTKHELCTCKIVYYFSGKSVDPCYVIKTGKKQWLIERVGKCDPKSCDSICCKFIHNTTKGYYSGFGKPAYRGVILDIECDRLRKSGTCKLWGKSNFPATYRQFPHPTDGVYWLSYNKCGFRFKKLKEVKDLK